MISLVYLSEQCLSFCPSHACECVMSTWTLHWFMKSKVKVISSSWGLHLWEQKNFLASCFFMNLDLSPKVKIKVTVTYNFMNTESQEFIRDFCQISYKPTFWFDGELVKFWGSKVSATLHTVQSQCSGINTKTTPPPFILVHNHTFSVLNVWLLQECKHQAGIF